MHSDHRLGSARPEPRLQHRRRARRRSVHLMASWLMAGGERDALSAIRDQFPVTETRLHVPTTSDHWDDLTEPLADVLTRGDVPTELESAKIAIMNLKLRAPKQFGAILSRVVELGALEALVNRIQQPVPSAVPPQSIWWREVCQSRLSDCQILSIFCHSLDLVKAIKPYRSSILKSIKFLLVSPQFKHIHSIRFLAVEIVISLIVLAPDFDTFVAIQKQGLFPVLCDLIGSSSENHPEREEWVVYDLGSPATPLSIQSICINIFAYVASECNIVSRGGPTSTEVKSMLAEIEGLPILLRAIDSVRDHRNTATPRYIIDALQHLPILFCFGGRAQCIQRDNADWVDCAAKFLSELPDKVSSNFGLISDELKTLCDRIRSDCNFLLDCIRQRHEPPKSISRARLPDLRQRFRGAATGSTPRTAPVNDGIAPGVSATSSSIETLKQNKLSCRTCGSQSELKRCQRCLSVQYCSRECQVSDWKRHKTECNKR